MDAKHPEDRKNTTLLIAVRRGDQVDLSWPEDLALARYLWRKTAANIAEAEYAGLRVAPDGWPQGNDPDTLAVEIQGDHVVFELPPDPALAKYLHAKLGAAMDDKEWEAYQSVRKLQGEMVKAQQRRVELGDARTLKRHRGGRN